MGRPLVTAHAWELARLYLATAIFVFLQIGVSSNPEFLLNAFRMRQVLCIFSLCLCTFHQLHQWVKLLAFLLQVMLEQMQGLMHLELSGCNDFTEAGLWSSLNARLTSLSVSDCINVADDAIAAISQLLPNLSELSLQAYHVTDTAMAYFTAKQVGCQNKRNQLGTLQSTFTHLNSIVILKYSVFNLILIITTCLYYKTN